MDESAVRPVVVSQAEKIIQKLALGSQLGTATADPEIAPLFPGYSFGPTLVAGLTPIERGGLLDVFIDRPKGMTGWIINLTVKGKGQVFDGVEFIEVSPGDMVLFPSHAIHYYGRHPAAASWWHRWIFFQPRAFWLNWLVWREERHGIFVLRHLDPDIFAELDDIFAETAIWSVQSDVLSTEIASNLVERIILLAAKQTQSVAAMHDLDERLMLAVKYMSDNLNRAVPLGEVAHYAHLSASRLSHLFSAKFGKSIMRWRDEQRVQFASQLLQLSNRSVKQIAAEVGYEDPLYFSRVFRRQTGTSPKAFREKCLSSHSRLVLQGREDAEPRRKEGMPPEKVGK